MAATAGPYCQVAIVLGLSRKGLEAGSPSGEKARPKQSVGAPSCHDITKRPSVSLAIAGYPLAPSKGPVLTRASLTRTSCALEPDTKGEEEDRRFHQNSNLALE